MPQLPHALERVRAALLGPRIPGKHSRPALLPVAPPHQPTPYVWGARLVDARRLRRERHAPPVEAPQSRAEWFPPEPWEHTGAMVRPYVAALGEAPRNARNGAQADPWEAAQ